MNGNLWSQNHPREFWRCQPNPPDDVWQKAIGASLPLLNLDSTTSGMDSIMELTLGESRFGPDHWRLSFPERMYYILKPLLPRTLTRLLRQKYHRLRWNAEHIPWPLEDRYVKFLWSVLEEVARSVPTGVEPQPLWPNRHLFAFVLTHDIETAEGQNFVRAVADLEEKLGFRSSFNFVPEEYLVDRFLVDELRQRGFEVGIHGLKHDGNLFNSRKRFEHCVPRINQYLREFGAVGFRSPLTHRHPEWMQALDIEYDLSFFDTDPFEPIPGGTMSIWPFFIGHFVELPYSLVQDHTLISILKETTPRIWLDKVDFIERYHGMALVNTHPDYLESKLTWNIYSEFLNEMKKRGGYWHALPCDVARWWRARSTPSPEIGLSGLRFSRVFLSAIA